MFLLVGFQVPAPAPVQTPSIIFDGASFHVRGLGKEVVEPLAGDLPPSRVTYRKDDSFAVWDSRGLSVRHRSFTLSTRLPEIALTPKLFPKEEIVANRAMIARGERFKEATALSGSRRIGDEVFFLVRWDDKSGKPWLEALVRVNLKLAKPKPELIGRFDGLSVARTLLDDQLVLIGASPAAFVRSETGAWGVGLLDRAKGEFAFNPLGQGLRSAIALSPRLALAMEDTGYGKVRVVRIDLVTGARRDVAELSGAPTFIDRETPALALVPTNLGDALRNLETGAQMSLPAKPVIRRTNAGILVWNEGQAETCTLYSPERFLKLASAAKVVGQKPNPAESVQQSKPTKRIPPP